MKTLLMKKGSGMPRIAALVLIAILCSFNIKSYAETWYMDSDGILRYAVVTEGVKVKLATGGVGSKGMYATSVDIPAEFEIKGTTYKVVEIEFKGFLEGASLREVTIGENVTKIGYSAFARANGNVLEKVVIKGNVTTYEENAFANCNKLKTIEFLGGGG